MDTQNYSVYSSGCQQNLCSQYGNKLSIMIWKRKKNTNHYQPNPIGKNILLLLMRSLSEHGWTQYSDPPKCLVHTQQVKQYTPQSHPSSTCASVATPDERRKSHGTALLFTLQAKTRIRLESKILLIESIFSDFENCYEITDQLRYVINKYKEHKYLNNSCLLLVPNQNNDNRTAKRWMTKPRQRFNVTYTFIRQDTNGSKCSLYILKEMLYYPRYVLPGAQEIKGTENHLCDLLDFLWWFQTLSVNLRFPVCWMRGCT